MVNNKNVYCVNYLKGDVHTTAAEKQRVYALRKVFSSLYQSYWLHYKYSKKT